MKKKLHPEILSTVTKRDDNKVNETYNDVNPSKISADYTLNSIWYN